MVKRSLLTAGFMGLISLGFAGQDPVSEVDFESFDTVVTGRFEQQVLKAGQPTSVELSGYAKSVTIDGNTALDISDVPGSTSCSLQLPDAYSPSIATIGFKMYVPKGGLDNDGGGAVIMEEETAGTQIALKVKKSGKMFLSHGALFIGPPITVQDLIERKTLKFQEDLYVAKMAMKEYKGIEGDLDEDQVQEVMLEVKANYKTEAEAEIASYKNHLNMIPKQFKTDCDPIANVKKMKEGWHHVAVSWDSHKGLYIVYLDGVLVLRTLIPAHSGGDRSSQDGAKLSFGTDRSAVKLVIDDIKVYPFLKDREFDSGSF